MKLPITDWQMSGDQIPGVLRHFAGVHQLSYRLLIPNDDLLNERVKGTVARILRLDHLTSFPASDGREEIVQHHLPSFLAGSTRDHPTKQELVI